MIRVGLTGGTGSGKSTVADRLRTLGATVVDADRLAREAVLPGSRGLKRVAEAFGEGMLQKDGSLDRKALAAVVFKDAAARERLNGILHPLVLSRMLALASRYAGLPAVVFDVPLLFESGFDAYMDVIWTVSAPMETRLARLMLRDGCTLEQAMARIDAQLDEETKQARSTAVLYNGGDLAELYERTDALWRELIKEKE